MKGLIISFAVALLVVTISCSNSSEPEQNKPGRRDYVWTVDTINPGHETLYLGRIWGSSQNDVWAVGSSSWSATSIWHYNGLRWKCDSIPRRINPFAVFGFSSNEVWLGNSNSTIWKYNGYQWLLFGEYKVDGYNRININNFSGISNSNVYGVGFADSNDDAKAIIIHYNGTVWDFVSIPYVKVGLETVAVDSKTGVLVMSGTVYDPSGFVAKIYCWDGKELKELLSDHGNTFVTKLGSEIYATHNSKIYKYSEKQITLWKDNTGAGITGNIICGRSGNDFFIGALGGISHYNGTDFKIIYNNELQHNIEVMRGVVFEKEVFFIAKDFTIGKNLIIHGKLK